MNTLRFNGIVISGEGNGRKYLELPWVKKQMKEKLGYLPYLGTLNLQLTKKSVATKKLLFEANSTLIYPAKGYCIGLLFKASITSLECAIILPQVEGYPENVLEIVAPVNLRQMLKLKDGDEVVVSAQV